MLVRRLAPTTVRYPGVGNLDRMRSDMMGLFDALLTPDVRTRGVFPAMNVTQDADAYYVRCELPGVNPDDIEVNVVNRTLSVSGKREVIQEEGVSYHRRERASGSFGRSVVLPLAVEAGSVDAAYRNGVLTITLPLADEVKPRQIAVRQG